MNDFVSVDRRPRFARGTRINGAGSVRSVLYCRDEFEVYLLVSRGLTHRVLALVHLLGRKDRLGPDELAQRLESGGAQIVAPYTWSEGIIGYFVDVKGIWLGDQLERAYSRDELYILLLALIVAAQRRGGDFCPILDPNVLWWGGPRAPGIITAILGDMPYSEASMVKRIIGSFLSIVIGHKYNKGDIEIGATAFRSWCKAADANLAELVARCASKRPSISSLDELSTAIDAAAPRSSSLISASWRRAS